MLLLKTLLIISSIWLLCSYHSSDALIVPQELPSLLSVVYSNIPPIKKGTDSRLGFGFRLGEHADFQVILELGPQKETRPLGDQDGDSSFNKRHVSKAEQNALTRQQLRQQLQQQQQQESTSTERNAANWLTSWSQDMNSDKKKASKSKSKQRETKKPQNEKFGSLPTLPVLPSQSLQQLQLLYKMATTTTGSPMIEKNPTSTESPISPDPKTIVDRLTRKAQITKELMDVSLDGDE